MATTTTFTDTDMATKTEPPVRDVNTTESAPVGKLGNAKRRFVPRKYNHLFAIHSKSKASCLTSQDAEETPSFVGFRNLMVLMLGMDQSHYYASGS
jgi:diacylglycerol O-acyltransferase-1